MPLTKRQFELGVYDETEGLMCLLYDLLSQNRHLAYSEGELLEMHNGKSEGRTGQIRRALDALTNAGAVQSREIDGTLYYAFYREVGPGHLGVEMNYWQVAAGEGTRDFSDLFLQYGVMLMGSGNLGSFSEHPENYEGKKDWRRKIVTLAKSMDCGDVVVMKKRWGTKGEIVAAGRVTSDYEWFEPFDDVEGWDLRHGRRVEWVKPVSPIPVDGLARGTISRVYKSNPKNAAERLLNEGEGTPVEKKDIPPPANSISEEHLVGSLIENGLRPADAEAVIRAIWHVRRLAGWYLFHGRDLSEHEIRTFLIVPILLALGWSEQRIKIEWNHTDISLFSEVFRKSVKPGDPRIILGVQAHGHGSGTRRAPSATVCQSLPGLQYACHIIGGALRFISEKGRPEVGCFKHER